MQYALYSREDASYVFIRTSLFYQDSKLVNSIEGKRQIALNALSETSIEQDELILKKWITEQKRTISGSFSYGVEKTNYFVIRI